MESLGTEDQAFPAVAQSATRAWAKIDQNEALQWGIKYLEATPKPLNTILGGIARTDALWARKLWEDVVLPRTGGDATFSEKDAASLAKTVAKSVPYADAATGAEMAQWALQLPDGEIRNSAIGPAVSGWAAKDRAAASDLVNSLEADGVRDHSVAALVGVLNESEPSNAWQWGMTIGDEELKLKTLYYTSEAWRKVNPSEANATVEAAGLTQKLIDTGKKLPKWGIRIVW